MEMHPGWRNDKILEACKENGIHVTVRPNNNSHYSYLILVDHLDFESFAGILSIGLTRSRQRSDP